jgi:HlyD family secretion protein
MLQRIRRWRLLVAATLGVAMIVAACVAFSSRAAEKAKAANESREKSDATGAEGGPRLRVEAVQPKAGGVERTSVQPGSVIAFESAQLFAKISGYLKSQPVDIGSQVKRGEVLAEIDAPELFKDVDRAKAAVDEAKAEVQQAEARVLTAQALREAAAAAVKQAEADVDRTAATRSFREKQFARFKELYALKSIDARLVDEKLQETDAAQAAESAARAAVITCQANVSSAAAKIEEAKSDVVHTQAQVEVAQAALAKAQVYVAYTQIVSPYDGVVTRRNFFRGDFIRAADQGGVLPLLAVDQTGIMRMVVQVPDRDVPFTNPGDAAEVEIDALPGLKFSAKVSRVADAEDPVTRTMRTEIDLANDRRLLRQGMYGRVTIHLTHHQKTLSIPSSCVAGDVEGDKGSVFVVQNGVAHLKRVRLGIDNGLRIEILGGLSPDDQVVQRPGGALTDGAAVEVISRRAAAEKE